MALDPNELFTTVSRGDSQPRMVIEAIQPKDFAAGAGDDLTTPLPVCTPVAFNDSTNLWAPWDADGSNGLETIAGFLSEETQLKAGAEIQANVVMRGKIHYQAILDAIEARAVEVEADLLTELQGSDKLRELGILVYGKPQIH